jgi:hypothetical protein
MTTPKNKGGRPSNAELAARGMTKTDLDIGLKTLKKYFGRSVEKIVELASNPQLPVDKQFKMNQDVINMFMAMLKADAMLKQAMARDNDNTDMKTDDEDKPKGVVFDF